MLGVALYIRFLAYAGITQAIRDYVTMLDIAPLIAFPSIITLIPSL